MALLKEKKSKYCIMDHQLNDYSTFSLVDGEPGSRYKCHPLKIKVDYKTKMAKTVLVNLRQIEKDLCIDARLVLKFLSFQLATNSGYMPKSKHCEEKSYLSGNFTNEQVSEAFQKFIKQVVICSKCGLPELQYRSRHGLEVICQACGTFSPQLKNVEWMNDKFSKYFEKFLQEYRRSCDESKPFSMFAWEGPEIATSLKKTCARFFPETSTNSSDDEEIVWFTDVSDEAVKKRAEQFQIKQ